MRSQTPGQILLGTTLLVLGIVGLIQGNYIAILEPVPTWMAEQGALADLSALLALGCGIGLLWKRTATMAARVLTAFLLLWMLFKLRLIVLAPTVEGSYQSCGETAVLVAGSWVLYGRLASEWDRRWLAIITGPRGLRIARTAYGLALISFGLSHFAYLDLTSPLGPYWLPSHVAWAYFTGGAYLAAAAAILINRYARLAATLTAVQMGFFLVLVWLPRVAASRASAFQQGEFLITWALAASAWVIAESYSGRPWLAPR